MAYTASALSFMLENLSKPVVFTGAMIPFFEGHSDARRNLLISIEIAANSNIPEVCLFFHDKLLRGNRSKKLNSLTLDAFISPNYPNLAKFGTSLVIDESHLRKPPRKKLKVNVNMDESVIVIRLIPGFASNIVEFMLNAHDLSKKLKCLVLELYGMGNFPSRQGKLLELLKKAVDNGIVIVVCSQCVYGEVDLGAYQVGKVLRDLGALSALDMTIEAVSTKLSYLLGQNYKGEDLKEKFRQNLRGELTIKE